MGVGGFNNGNGISNRKTERISTKKVPDACFDELLLRLMLEVRNEKTDTTSLEKTCQHMLSRSPEHDLVPCTLQKAHKISATHWIPVLIYQFQEGQGKVLTRHHICRHQPCGKQ